MGEHHGFRVGYLKGVVIREGLSQDGIWIAIVEAFSSWNLVDRGIKLSECCYRIIDQIVFMSPPPLPYATLFEMSWVAI